MTLLEIPLAGEWGPMRNLSQLRGPHIKLPNATLLFSTNPLSALLDPTVTHVLSSHTRRAYRFYKYCKSMSSAFKVGTSNRQLPKKKKRYIKKKTRERGREGRRVLKMEAKGGCCIARYSGAGGGAYNMSSVDRIMLRFRPIAPKPANTGSTSLEISEVSSRSSRGKRRFNSTNGNGNNNNNNNKRCNNGNNNRKRKTSTVEKSDSAVATLPLLPETPDLLSPKQAKNVPTWLSFGSDENSHHHDLMMISEATSFGMSLDHRTVTNPQIMRVVMGSCVTVECVSDSWVDADGLGYTDDQKKMNLEIDTCPGFISDGFGRVIWTNEAYKKMVGQGEHSRGFNNEGEVVVWLVMKDKLTATATATATNIRAFTCRVRVQNQSAYRNGKERRSITVPCDVWRMDSGGFAWRLDVKAALSLGW